MCKDVGIYSRIIKREIILICLNQFILEKLINNDVYEGINKK